MCIPEQTCASNCTATNDCDPDPCQNGATCLDFEVGFMCMCVSGWAGHLCENNINKCTANSCLNGGTCMDLLDDFRCECPLAFTGKSCETDIQECSLFMPCEHGGQS